MLWKQQEIGAHTGVGEETPPSPPPKKTKTKTKTKKTRRMLLDYKLVPDSSQEYKYNLNH